ncbi:uncharacterized protein DUF4255 [Nitrosospira sp. Nsp5]|uniref:Pvc16 N-terminal domain-containing protein n=1 Tax=Nitrosospira multiformis TaxID=1231 RepID=A0ABY0THL4_9PROT|nr:MULTISPECIES: DUF4255 domain-containing protein [Nitrosospira]PTR05761.1 uncharacterized protein DUF4255 [Nitrosospira sp. Nsp5]SDQ62315.1 Protein of unknown function [Nitrosospira multiformis]
MSNSLAIATVTAALRQITHHAVSSAVSGAEALIERPLSSISDDDPRVRLFLYQVTPNAALRNDDLPTRAASGSLMKRPTAALDLHYLLAFYGNESDLEPQRMLGAVIRDLHAQPVLLRQVIVNAITSDGSLLTGSNLAEAFEQIKFTPLSLSLEELSKLWSVFFQAPYALSVAYQGTVVLIDSEENAPLAAPVLRRGEADRGVNLALGPFPALESFHIGAPEDEGWRPRQPSYPSAQLGTVLTLIGRNLGGETVSVRFHHIKLGVTRTIVVAQNDKTATEIKIGIGIGDDAAARAAWAAGFYIVTVLIENGGHPRASNQLPLPFSSRISGIAPSVRAGRDVTLTITFDPEVRSTQRASLIIMDREIEAEDPVTETGELRFIIEDAPTVTDAIVRLRIDGVDSLPFRRQPGPPPARMVFDENQKITIL